MMLSDIELQISEDVAALLHTYYRQRRLAYPDAMEALGFAATELGEAFDILLDDLNKFTRNHPEEHPPFSHEEFAEECWDLIMMAMMAGFAKSVNPLEFGFKKLRRKLSEQGIDPGLLVKDLNGRKE